jgi:hypothetical protein
VIFISGHKNLGCFLQSYVFLVKSTYDLHKKVGIADNIQSAVLQGFVIPVQAIFDAAANAEALRQLVTTP